MNRTASRIPNLGRVLTILIMPEVERISMHEDVSAWGAPSECHRDVESACAGADRLARRLAEAEARRPLRAILREAKKRGFEMAGPKYERAFGRIYARHGFPY